MEIGREEILETGERVGGRDGLQPPSRRW